MPTYDGIGSSITHRVEVVGDSLFQDVDGGTLSTKVPVQIFSNYYASPGSVDSSRQLRFRVQPDGESNVSNSYVTDMGVKGADGSNYFFITAPQNTSNVGDQNTFVISTTSNVGIGTTDPEKPLHVVGDSWVTGTLTASNIVGASPVTISSSIVMAAGTTLTTGAIEPPAGSESNLKITGTITTSNIVANTGDNLLVSSNLEVGTSNLFVDTATGKVGIGTTNPKTKLHVSHDLHLQASSETWNTTAGPGLYLRYSTNSGQDEGYIQSIDRRPGGTTKPMVLEASQYYFNGGNVGIGVVSPGAPLEVVSTRNADTWSSGASQLNVLNYNGFGSWYGMSFAVSQSRGNGVIQTFNKNSGAAAYHLELQPSAGNVGIGITNPSYKLDVAGDIRASSSILGGTSTDTSRVYSHLSNMNTGESKYLTFGKANSARNQAELWYAHLGGDGSYSNKVGLSLHSQVLLTGTGDGNVQKPYQSACRVSFNNVQWTTSYASVLTIIYNYELYDINNDYSTSTGKFTCPHDGRYLAFHVLTGRSTVTTNGIVEAKLYHNGNEVNRQFMGYGSGNYNATAACIINASANDTINAGMWNGDGNNQFNGDQEGGGSQFIVYFLG